jgi:hypothetical protein
MWPNDSKITDRGHDVPPLPLVEAMTQVVGVLGLNRLPKCIFDDQH